MSLKRSNSASPEPSSSSPKRLRVESAPEPKAPSCQIVDLSDDVLLYIMKFLKCVDLFNLGLVCQRFYRVTKDWTLWENVDLMDKPLHVNEILQQPHIFQSVTKRIAVTAGDMKDDVELSGIINLVRRNCPNIKELTVENYVINTNKLQMQNFPPSLETLSMKGTTLEVDLPPRTPFFTKLDAYMPRLTCLILSHCDWVQSQSLLPLSKLPKLKELRLDSCRQFCECVAYASLAAKFGFKALEILDVRKTALGDSDISSFSFTTSLTHLYLENYDEEATAHDSDEEPANELPFLGGQRVYEDENIVEIIPNGRIDISLDTFRPGVISDRSICMISKNRNEDGEGPHISSNPNLKSLVIRNYPKVTNSSIIHLFLCAPPSFEYLDVTGTSVTKECIIWFKKYRKHITVVSSFDDELEDELDDDDDEIAPDFDAIADFIARARARAHVRAHVRAHAHAHVHANNANNANANADADADAEADADADG